MYIPFSGTNPYLTFHCVNQGTILIDLAPDDKEYQSVEEEVIIICKHLGLTHDQDISKFLGCFHTRCLKFDAHALCLDS